MADFVLRYVKHITKSFSTHSMNNIIIVNMVLIIESGFFFFLKNKIILIIIIIKKHNYYYYYYYCYYYYYYYYHYNIIKYLSSSSFGPYAFYPFVQEHILFVDVSKRIILIEVDFDYSICKMLAAFQ